MKKHLILIVSTALLALLAGCFSMESAPMSLSPREQIHLRSTDALPAEHVVIANSGWFLFNAWPLACGNAGENATFPWRLFSDCVNLDLLHNRLTKYASIRKYNAEDLRVYKSEQVFLSIPGTSLPIPIPYIITYRELQISSVLTKPIKKGGVQ